MQGRGMVFLGLGFELFAMAMAAAWLGPIIDEKLSWRGYGFLLIMGACFVAWVIHIVVLVKRFMKEDEALLEKENRE